MKGLDVRTGIKLRNILFATDFSDAANAAAPYAAELAKRHGAKLYALHVRPAVSQAVVPPEAWEGLVKAGEIEAARQSREVLRVFPGMRVEVLIAEGDLWSSLAAAIKENNIDLLVAGTRGRSGIGKFLLGSVAEEILRKAPCPVLTVGPHAEADRNRIGQIRHILFATNFELQSLAAAPYAISLAQDFQASLTLLHVIEEPKEGELIIPEELQSASMNLLHNLVSEEAELPRTPEYIVERVAPADKILEVAAKRGADLIVLGARKPSGFPGAASHLPIATAHKVISSAMCPVLTVRA